MELAEVRRKNAALRYLQVVAIPIAYPTLLQCKASGVQTYVWKPSTRECRSHGALDCAKRDTRGSAEGYRKSQGGQGVSSATKSSCPLYWWVYKTDPFSPQEGLNADSAVVSDTVARTRSRIVQSPERIRRNISSMSTTAMEDKKTLGAQEAKARDLQAKISALLNIEKVLYFTSMFSVDLTTFLFTLIRTSEGPWSSYKLLRRKLTLLNSPKKSSLTLETISTKRKLSVQN